MACGSIRMRCHFSKWHDRQRRGYHGERGLHPFLKEFTGDTERFKHPYWLFELPHLLCIERELNKYDYTLSSTFHMFLPGKPHKARVMPLRLYNLRFDKTSVKTLYPNTDFPKCVK